MRLLWIIIFSFYFAEVHACKNKIDPLKVMIFVDTNNSEPEFLSARKAACARGEKLIIIPKNYQEYDRYKTALERARLNTKNCMPNCKALIGEFKKAQDAFIRFKYDQPTMKDQLKEALQEIKISHGTLQNIILSGHDGGGTFSGDKGDLDRYQIQEVMEDFKEINKVKSLMLLGCYTGTQKEAISWKNIFPQSAMIAGYDGSAPLSDKPQGHQFITDFLTKEKILTKQADAKKLQAYVSTQIKSLNHLNAGIFVECSNKQENKSYYYGSESNRKFKEMDVKACQEKKQELIDVVNKVSLFYEGILEPPSDTQNGDLRKLYNKARTFEHCEDILNIGLDLNKIFNLLFHEGYKQSFAKFYENDLLEAEKTLKDLTSIWAPHSKNLQEKTRKDILRNIHDMHGILSQQNITAEQRRVLSWLKQVTTMHLQYFMNPFSWHEYRGGAVATPESGLNRLRDFKLYEPTSSPSDSSSTGGSTGGQIWER